MSRWLDLARAAKRGSSPITFPVPIAPKAPKGHAMGAFGTNGAIGTKVETSSRVQTCLDSLTKDKRERFEERAAIMEFDGGLSRQDAEQSALHDIIGDN